MVVLINSTWVLVFIIKRLKKQGHSVTMARFLLCPIKTIGMKTHP